MKKHIANDEKAGPKCV